MCMRTTNHGGDQSPSCGLVQGFSLNPVVLVDRLRKKWSTAITHKRLARGYSLTPRADYTRTIINGCPVIVKDGYTFGLFRVVGRANGHNWRCRSKNCSVTARLYGGSFLVKGVHKHASTRSTEQRRQLTTKRMEARYIGRVKPQDYHFADSRSGNKLIVWRGFRYSFGYKSQGKLMYYCTSRPGCRASLLHNKDRSLTPGRSHSHPAPEPFAGICSENEYALEEEVKPAESDDDGTTTVTVKPDEYTFAETKVGNKLIIWQGFRYAKRLWRDVLGRYYYCTKNNGGIKCMAYVKMNKDGSLTAHNAHSHGPFEVRGKNKDADVEEAEELEEQDNDNTTDEQDYEVLEETAEEESNYIGTVKPEDYKFAESRVGGPIIVWQGFRYGFSYNKQTNRVYNCTSRPRCYASIIFHEDHSLTPGNPHTHPPPGASGSSGVNKYAIVEEEDASVEQDNDNYTVEPVYEATEEHSEGGAGYVGAVKPGEYEFVKSKKGGELIVWKGFRYSFSYYKKSNPVYHCTSRTRGRCNASLIFHDDRSFTPNLRHSHPPPNTHILSDVSGKNKDAYVEKAEDFEGQDIDYTINEQDYVATEENAEDDIYSGAVKPGEYKFVKGRGEAQLIVWRGFRYSFYYRKAAKQVYQCTSRPKCNATLILHEDRSFTPGPPHSHPPPGAHTSTDFRGNIEDNLVEKEEDDQDDNAIDDPDYEIEAQIDSKPSTVGSVKRAEYEICRSRRGNKVIVWKGFRYCRPPHGGKNNRRWFCTKDKDKGHNPRCRAYVVRNRDGSLNPFNKHTHRPPSMKPKKGSKKTKTVEQEISGGHEEDTEPNCEAEVENVDEDETTALSVKAEEYTFSETRLGNKLLVCQGFRYVRKIYEGKEHWRCTGDGGKGKCLAYVLLKSNGSLTAYHSHSHPKPGTKRKEEDKEYVGPVKPGQFEFSTTTWGNKVILWRGFRYIRRVVKGIIRRRWLCSRNNSRGMKCRASVLLNKDGSVTPMNSHCHTPKGVAAQGGRKIVKRIEQTEENEGWGEEKKEADAGITTAQPGEYEFSRGRLGSKIITWRGFRYGQRVERSGRKLNTWHCTSNGSDGTRCSAFVVHNRDGSLILNHSHFHPPRRIKATGKKRSKTTDFALEQNESLGNQKEIEVEPNTVEEEEIATETVMPGEYRFSQSSRGNKLIQWRGFRYGVRRQIDKQGRYWHCTKDGGGRSRRCPANVFLNDDGSLTSYKTHTHPPRDSVTSFEENEDEFAEKDSNVEEAEESSSLIGSVTPGDYSYSKSRSGTTLIVCRGFRYGKVSVINNKHKRVWKCTSARSFRCNATLLLHEDQSITLRQLHSHLAPGEINKNDGEEEIEEEEHVEEESNFSQAFEETTSEEENEEADPVEGKAAFTGSIKPGEYVFSKGIRGSKVLVYQGFRFGLIKKGSQTWKCTSNRGYRCHAYVVLNSDRSLNFYHSHCHPPPTMKIKEKKVKEEPVDEEMSVAAIVKTEREDTVDIVEGDNEYDYNRINDEVIDHSTQHVDNVEMNIDNSAVEHDNDKNNQNILNDDDDMNVDCAVNDKSGKDDTCDRSAYDMDINKEMSIDNADIELNNVNKASNRSVLNTENDIVNFDIAVSINDEASDHSAARVDNDEMDVDNIDTENDTDNENAQNRDTNDIHFEIAVSSNSVNDDANEIHSENKDIEGMDDDDKMNDTNA